MDTDLDVTSYTTSELLKYFGLTHASDHQELVAAYNMKLKNVLKLSSISHQEDFTSFLDKCYEILEVVVSKDMMKRQINPITPDVTSYLLNVDSTFRNQKQSASSTDFTIELPTNLDRVISMKIVSSEIPLISYNFSSRNKNNSFLIKINDDEPVILTIPDGCWYSKELSDFINSALSASETANILRFNIDDQSGKSSFHFISEQVNKSYSITNRYNHNDFSKSCLYILGFSESDLRIVNDQDTYLYGTEVYYGWWSSSGVFGRTFDPYYYVYVDDFVGNSTNHQIIGIQPEGYIGTNYLARVEVRCSAFNRNIGHKTYIERNYFGGVRIRKLHIKILDKFGNVIDIGDSNISLLFKFVREYSS